MNDEIKLFYNELRKIQEFAVGVSLSKQTQYEHIEDMLNDVTYDVIYMICEMIDGYRNNLIDYDIVNRKSNLLLNDKIELHDWCEAYLKCTDI